MDTPSPPPPGAVTDLGDAVDRVRRVLVVDDMLRAADRLLAVRLWTPGQAEQVAVHLGRARWALLTRDAPGSSDAAGGAPLVRPADAVDEWEHVRAADQSAVLARLLTRFAVRNGVEVPAHDPARLVLVEDAWRLGDPLRRRAVARVRRELLACPVVAYGSRPHAWMVFAAPGSTTLPAWQVEGRQLLTDLGRAASTGDRALWRAFGVLLTEGVPARTAFREALAGSS